MSPLRLGPFDDVVHDAFDGLATTGRLVALGIFAFGAEPLLLPQRLAIRLVDDLDVQRDLELTPRGQGLLRRRGTVAHGDIDVVPAHDAAHDRVSTLLWRVAHT